MFSYIYYEFREPTRILPVMAIVSIFLCMFFTYLGQYSPKNPFP